jgi:hypothetical protein
MDDSLFNDYIERVVLPIYPNISKTAKFDPNTPGSWSKVRFCPFNRNCVQSKNVRHELGQASKDQALEDLHESYARSVCHSDEHGLNAGIFDGRVPVATHGVEREEDEEIQVQKLLATKSSFSVGALWNTFGTRIGNASAVLRAQTAQLALEANKLATQS